MISIMSSDFYLLKSPLLALGDCSKSIIIIIIIYLFIYFTPWEFFTSALADGLSLMFE